MLRFDVFRAMRVCVCPQRAQAICRIHLPSQKQIVNYACIPNQRLLCLRAFSSMGESESNFLGQGHHRKLKKKLLEPSLFDSAVTFEEAFGQNGVSPQVWPAQVTRLLQSLSRRGLTDATYNCIQEAVSRGISLRPWHFAIAMKTCHKGNRSDLSIQLRKMMLTSGVSVTPLSHAASLPSLRCDEVISLARELEASDSVSPARDPWFYFGLVQTLFSQSNPDAAMSEFESAMSKGLLPPGVSTVSAVATGRRDAQLFDAVWSVVIEGLGRTGQPERANKAFEEMLAQLSADAAAATLASEKRTGWRSRHADMPALRDARLFDAYLRAAASAQFLFPHVLDIFDIMNSHRSSPSTHTYCAYIACCCKFNQFSEAERRFDEFMSSFVSPQTTPEQQVEHQALTSTAAAAVEAVAGAAFKSLAYRTSKRSVADRHLSWQLAQHILLRSALSGAHLSPRSVGWMVTVAAEGGFIRSFMESVVPLIRDKAMLVSNEGVAVMTKHMCDKGNGNSAITWLLMCRGLGATIDQRWLGRALVACASQGPKIFAHATEKLISSGLPPSSFEGDAAALFAAASQAVAAPIPPLSSSLSEGIPPQ